MTRFIPTGTWLLLGMILWGAPPLLSGGLRAATVDVHVYAEDTAREVAALIKPGSALQIEAPDSYYQQGVAAQLRARGFTIVAAGTGSGQPLHYALSESGHGAVQVNLVVGLDAFVRSYDPVSGKPIVEWRGMQPVVAVQAPAQSEPDRLYSLGRDVESSSPLRAMEYYKLAADLGQINASVRVGLLLIAQNRPGDGVPYIVRAANGGNAQANYVLGLAYLNGAGVSKDPVKARAWLVKARDRGFAPASQVLSTLPSAR